MLNGNWGMGNRIYVDPLRGEAEGFRVRLPDGKTIDYELEEGEYDSRGKIGCWALKDGEPIFSRSRKRDARRRLAEVMEKDLVKLATEYSTDFAIRIS